jgi:hypothetical protein
LSRGVHYSCRNKRGATTTTTKKKKNKKAIQKNLEQHSCLLSDREENPLLRSSSSPPPLSCFLFSGIAQSAILRQTNEDFQKQLQQQLQEMDSSIFRFLPKMRRDREREIEGAAVVQFLRISSIKLLTSSSNKHSRKQACFHVCLFVCLLVVAIVDRRRSDLCVLYLSVLRRVVIYSCDHHASSSSSCSREHLRSFSDFGSCSILHNKRDNTQQHAQSPRKCRSLGFFFCGWCFRRRCRLLLLLVCFLLQFVEEDELPSD